VILSDHFPVVVHFIVALFADSRYSRYLKRQVKLFIDFIIAANENEIQDALFYQTMLDAARRVFPNATAVQTAIEFARYVTERRAEITAQDRKYEQVLELVRNLVIATRCCFPTCGVVFPPRDPSAGVLSAELVPPGELDCDPLGIDA
jgi:hypothetical protein